MAGDWGDTWDLSPAEEQRVARAITGAGCGWALGVVGLAVAGLFVSVFFVFSDASNHFSFDTCLTFDEGSRIRWVDRAAGDLLAPEAAPAASPTLVVTGEAVDQDVAYVPLVSPAVAPQQIATRKGSAVSPTGKYLVIYESAVKQVVIDLASKRVIAEITGDAGLVFTGPDEGLVFYGRDSCEFHGARRVKFARRSSRSFNVTGISDGVAPFAVVGRDLVVSHIVPGDSSPTLDGVSRIDLGSGRAHSIAPAGRVAAVTSAPRRIWISTGRKTRVLNFDGSVVSTGALGVIAAPLENGRVAYTGDYYESDATVRIASADGPQQSDPVLPLPGDVEALAQGPAPTEVTVVWSSDGQAGGYDVCDVVALTCRTILRTETYPDLLYVLLGVVGIPQ